MIAPPKQWSLTLALTNADENSIWDKLYRNKMDDKSFYSFKDGIENIINNAKVVYLQNGVELGYFDEYHCQVRRVITSNATKSVLAISLFFVK